MSNVCITTAAAKTQVVLEHARQIDHLIGDLVFHLVPMHLGIEIQPNDLFCWSFWDCRTEANVEVHFRFDFETQIIEALAKLARRVEGHDRGLPYQTEYLG